MKFVDTYSHHNGVDLWKERDYYEWLTDIFEVPKLKVEGRVTTEIRNHVKDELEKNGWGFNIKIDAEVDLAIFAKKGDLAIQIQTGNISRYTYDLLKIQHLYVRKEIEAAALAVPTKDAAKKIGSNIAHVERIWNEIKVFDRVITTPLMLIAFE